MKPHSTHTIFLYDGTFEGLLTVVFEAFERKIDPMDIRVAGRVAMDLFADTIDVVVDEQKADRVWQGLVKKTSRRNARLVHVAFLSEREGVEMLLWCYLQKIFTHQHPAFWQNMLDPDVSNMVQTARKVQREAHRFLGLVRFQKTADGMFFALIDPDHNILWLIERHFRGRYASQPWIIYDTGRKYGIYYDMKEVQEMHIHNPAADLQKGRLEPGVRDMDEDHFRNLWQAYYRSITIEQRANPRQMLRMMPRRYWKYLPEKDGDEPA